MTNKIKKLCYNFFTYLIQNNNSKLKNNSSEKNQEDNPLKNTDNIFISKYKETFRVLNQNNFFTYDNEEHNSYISKSKFKTTLNHNDQNFTLEFLHIFDYHKRQSQNICTISLQKEELFTIQLTEEKSCYESQKQFLIKIKDNYIEKENHSSLLESINALSIFEKIHSIQLEIYNKNKETTIDSNKQKKLDQKTLVNNTLSKINQLREDSIYDNNSYDNKSTKINHKN